MHTIFAFRPSRLALAFAGVAAYSGAFAQTQPDAGSVLLEQAPRLEAPKPSLKLDLPAPARIVTPPGGPKVTLTAVGFKGHTVFAESALLAVLGDVAGKSFDLSELRELTNRIADHYRAAGYPFTRVYLPPQAFADGKLVIEVVEGRYGAVKASGDPELVDGAQAFLADLVPGDLIESSRLERASLILDDLPGIRIAPVIRPGEAAGTGDLDVEVARDKTYSGEAGIDNHGNRYTGRTRARANIDAGSQFMLGDQISLHAMATDIGMWFGQVGYSLPLGTSGLRASLGYSRTYYELGGEFSSLKAHGTADVVSAGFSYPLHRSQSANLNLSATLQSKKLNDRQDATDTDSRKTANAIPLALNYDLRDGIGNGGITYGAVAWTSGRLRLDTVSRATDATTAQTEGGFGKLNFDVARVQLLDDGWSLFGQVSAQWTHSNLDSSEKFGLGGPSGVRAYPTGEGYGDKGWLARLEVRYSVGPYTPYVFHDAGKVTVNAEPWQAGDNERSLGGAGLGARYQEGAISADLSLAWRTRGDAPQSDTQDQRPRVWLNVGYKF